MNDDDIKKILDENISYFEYGKDAFESRKQELHSRANDVKLYITNLINDIEKVNFHEEYIEDGIKAIDTIQKIIRVFEDKHAGD